MEDQFSRVQSALPAVTAALALQAEPIVERDLQRELVGSLSDEVPKVTAEVSVPLDGWHGQVGPVDVAIEDDSGVILVELKWGGRALEACAWDAVKMALALAEARASAAYLVAGARVEDWARHPAAELFETRTWRLDSLLETFARDFAFWKRDVQNHPLRLPCEWTTLAVAREDFEIGGEAWSLRGVEVAEPGRVVPVEYGPVVAKWRRGVSQPQPTPNEGAEPPEPAPVTVGSFENRTLAEEEFGPMIASGKGEGFSCFIGPGNLLGLDSGTVIGLLPPDEATAHAKDAFVVKRFASPVERRAYLAQRKLVGESWHPDALELWGSVGFGATWELRWDGRRLHYERMGDGPMRTKLLSPAAEDWGAFWRALDRINIWDWSPHYEPRDMRTDGYRWSIGVARLGRSVMADGYDVFPENGGSVEIGAADWSEYMAAVRRLAGGLPLD